MTPTGWIAFVVFVLALLLLAALIGIRRALPQLTRAQLWQRESEPAPAILPAPQESDVRPRETAGDILNLRGRDVSDVMIHRTKMLTVNIEAPAREVVQEVLQAPVSRLPLWSGKPENIVGVLDVTDLLRALHAAGSAAAKVDPRTLITPPWFVPESTPLLDQLKAFRQRKTSLAFVVDEYGEVMGLVTLADILEEVVGDIADAHDPLVEGVRRQSDGSVLVEGGVSIRDLNRAFDWSLPDEEATTIGGLVIHEARSIPEAGQNFTFHGLRFRVLRRAGHRIATLRIIPLQKSAAPGASPHS